MLTEENLFADTPFFEEIEEEKGALTIAEEREALTEDNLFRHAEKCSFDVFYRQLLAANNVNVAIQDKTGRTVFHYIAERYDQDNSETLADLFNFLKDKIDANKRSANGQIPIHLAIKGQNLNIFRALLPLSKLDCMLEDWTLLHYAVKYYHPDIFAVLVKNISADILRIQDDNGLTPLGLAMGLYGENKIVLETIQERLFALLGKEIDISKTDRQTDEDKLTDTGQGPITRRQKRKRNQERLQKSSSSEGESAENLQQFLRSQDEKILKLNELVAALTNNKEDQEQLIKKLNQTIKNLQSQLVFVLGKNRSLAEQNVHLKGEIKRITDKDSGKVSGYQFFRK